MITIKKHSSNRMINIFDNRKIRELENMKSSVGTPDEVLNNVYSVLNIIYFFLDEGISLSFSY